MYVWACLIQCVALTQTVKPCNSVLKRTIQIKLLLILLSLKITQLQYLKSITTATIPRKDKKKRLWKCKYFILFFLTWKPPHPHKNLMFGHIKGWNVDFCISISDSACNFVIKIKQLFFPTVLLDFHVFTE